MNKNIGFVSFMPDSGHIAPLLRLATSFAEKKYNVTCYFPEESIEFASKFNVPVKSLGKVTVGINGEIFARLSARSIFYNAFSFYFDLGKGYMQPIQLNIAEKTEAFKRVYCTENLLFASLSCLTNHITVRLWNYFMLESDFGKIKHRPA